VNAADDRAEADVDDPGADGGAADDAGAETAAGPTPPNARHSLEEDAERARAIAERGLILRTTDRSDDAAVDAFLVGAYRRAWDEGLTA